MGIEDRSPGEKAVYDAALAHGTLQPNLAAGREVYTTFRDPVLINYFNQRPVHPPLLPALYLQATLYPYGLPAGPLYRLEANPALRGWSRAQLEALFGTTAPTAQ